MSGEDDEDASVRDMLARIDTVELAKSYDRTSAGLQFRSGRQLIDTIGVWGGQRVLDVGCGTGLLAAYVAGRVGPSGYVLGIDPLRMRIALAQMRAHETLAFRVGSARDVEAMPPADFDLVYLNAVFPWVPDKLRAMRAFARVLRPSGRLAIACMVKALDRGPSIRSVLNAVRREVSEEADEDTRVNLGSPVDEREIPALVKGAGLTIRRMDFHDSQRFFATPEDAVRHIEMTSGGTAISRLPESKQRAARDALLRGLAEIATPQGIPRRGRRMVMVAQPM